MNLTFFKMGKTEELNGSVLRMFICGLEHCVIWRCGFRSPKSIDKRYLKPWNKRDCLGWEDEEREERAGGGRSGEGD